MPKYVLQKSFGFTLIEILVSLSIVGILAALTIPNLHRFNEQEILQTEVGKILSVLRQAQSNAQSGLICPNSGGAANQWQVTFSSSGTGENTIYSYSLIARCLNDTINEVRQTFTIPQGITLAIQGTNNVINNGEVATCTLNQNSHIAFTRTTTQLLCSDISTLNDMTIVLTNSSINTSKRLIIKNGGSINAE